MCVGQVQKGGAKMGLNGKRREALALKNYLWFGVCNN